VATLRQLAARARIVVMGLEHGHHDRLACLDAGATICLTKDSPLDDLINRLRAPYEAAAAAAAPLETAPPVYRPGWGNYGLGGEGATVNLTRREREVITLVRLGFTNQDIAEALVIEIGTVKNHVHNILRKLNVNSRREAVQVSRQAGLWGPHEARRKDEAAYAAPQPSRYAMRAAANV
jgi:DNA-binding NarL/FixJ family response regulator